MGTAVTDVANPQEPKAEQEISTSTIETGVETRGIGSPISNEAYNVIAALHAKLEGLEAYRKFSKDCDAELWKSLTENELSSVSKLVDKLEQLVESDAFRMCEPGEAKH